MEKCMGWRGVSDLRAQIQQEHIQELYVLNLVKDKICPTLKSMSL
jgi:hypothetical protein